MEEDEQEEEEAGGGRLGKEEVEDEEHEEEGRVWRKMKRRGRTRAEMLRETGELRPKLV